MSSAPVTFTRAGVWRGFVLAQPLAPGVALYALVFGALAGERGLSWLQAVLPKPPPPSEEMAPGVAVPPPAEKSPSQAMKEALKKAPEMAPDGGAARTIDTIPDGRPSPRAADAGGRDGG